MRNAARLIALTTACVLSVSSLAWSVNNVRVESKDNVTPGATGVIIGVYFTNDIPITGAVLPLEIRTWSGGAYMASGTFTRIQNSGGRMYNSPLGPVDDPGGAWIAASVTNRTFAKLSTSSGGCNRSFFQSSGPLRWDTSAAQPDFTSPDAIFMATVSQGDPGIGQAITLDPGADPDGTPSYRIICNVGNAVGIFVIDTTCIGPANHLGFVDNSPTPQTVIPTFTPGYIGVGVVAGVRDVDGNSPLPASYALDQNYPNPFNAGTNIRFTTLTDGRVTLDVYNVLGQKVRTLVNEQMSSGTHEADWDGRDGNGNVLSTGVYFYRIQAQGFTSTRKMVMIK